MVVEPKDAATVILLKKPHGTDEEGFKVLMVLRHPDSKFVPDSYVFPGGCLDEDDYAPEMENLCTGMDQQRALDVLDNIVSPEKALGAWVAGIRETFEEVSLLLAYQRDGSLIKFDSDDMVKRFCSHRLSLFEGRLKLKDLFREEDLTLAVDRLHYFSHWVTPEFLPLRYDVRFFVAEAPEGQEAIHDGVELTKHVWITPQDALGRFREKRCNMVLPTLVTMKELSQYKTIDEVIRTTKEKKINGILTKMVETDGEIVEYMPDGQAFKGMPRSI